MYEDADVLIVLSRNHIYKLHSNIIRRSAPILGNLLTEDTAAQLTGRARNKGATLRWRINLDVEVNEHRNSTDCYFAPGVSRFLLPVLSFASRYLTSGRK